MQCSSLTFTITYLVGNEQSFPYTPYIDTQVYSVKINPADGGYDLIGLVICFGIPTISDILDHCYH